MKFLIVDDNQDLVEVIELFIHSRLKAEVVKAYDGQSARKLFFEKGPFSIVISDYNMPLMNGGQLYQEIRQKDRAVPFILITSDPNKIENQFKNDPYFEFLEKPFVEELFFKLVGKFVVLGKAKGSNEDLLSGEFQADELAFVPVDLDLLKKISFLSSSLYLKISHQKFVKVLHGNQTFSIDEYEKYKNKGIENLYVDRFEFENFISNYRKKVFFNEFWDKLTPVESTEMLATDLDLVNKASKVFGWSPAVIELAKKNIQNVLELADKNTDFKVLREIYQSKKSIRLATHSIILCYTLTSCLKQLGWDGDNEIQKLTFAALMHDMDLDEDQFVTKQNLLLEPNINAFLSDPEVVRIIKHPETTAQKVASWMLAPPDVDQIIEQHHERPDGTGWPKGLRGNQINKLAAVFILCEDVLYHCLENFNTNPKDYLKSKKQFYSQEPFKLVYKALLETID